MSRVTITPIPSAKQGGLPGVKQSHAATSKPLGIPKGSVHAARSAIEERSGVGQARSAGKPVKAFPMETFGGRAAAAPASTLESIPAPTPAPAPAPTQPARKKNIENFLTSF